MTYVTNAISWSGAERNKGKRMSTDALFHLKSFRFERQRIGKEFLVMMKRINLNANRSSNRKGVVSQLDLFADLSPEISDARIKTDRLFHATLEILQIR